MDKPPFLQAVRRQPQLEGRRRRRAEHRDGEEGGQGKDEPGQHRGGQQWRVCGAGAGRAWGRAERHRYVLIKLKEAEPLEREHTVRTNPSDSHPTFPLCAGELVCAAYA